MQVLHFFFFIIWCGVLRTPSATLRRVLQVRFVGSAMYVRVLRIFEDILWFVFRYAQEFCNEAPRCYRRKVADICFVDAGNNSLAISVSEMRHFQLMSCSFLHLQVNLWQDAFVICQFRAWLCCAIMQIYKYQIFDILETSRLSNELSHFHMVWHIGQKMSLCVLSCGMR